MNDVALVCPHCNARRAGVAPGLAGKALSPQEIRAIVLSNAMLAPAPSQGLIPALILPHASTTGGARIAELALTIISLPLVAAGVASLALSRRKTRKTYDATQGEFGPVMAMLGLGGLGLTTVLSLAGASLTSNLAITGVCVVALIARAVIRSLAAREHHRDLASLAEPPVAAQASSAPRVPPAAAAAGNAAPDPSDGPRLLG